MRIVSLVPSLTHMLVDLGLEQHIVGCTNFCVEPPRLAKRCTLVGGTKDPNLETIQSLRPTHILANEEENKAEHIAACQTIADTFVTFPKNPREVPSLIRDAGAWLSVMGTADRYAQQGERLLADLSEAVSAKRRQGSWPERRYLYYIWREPYMVVSEDTYISGMLDLLGWKNVAPLSPRYPTLTVDDARSLAPDLLLLSSEPYPFRRRDAARLREEWASAPEILKIDGQLMSWYGTMLIPALEDMRRFVDDRSATKLISPLS